MTNGAKFDRQFDRQRDRKMSFSRLDRFDTALENQIKRFSDDKRQAIMSDAGDQDKWRETIRVQLEAELEARVREVLASRSTLKRSNKTHENADADLPNRPSLIDSNDPVVTIKDPTENEKEHSEESREWRATEMRRRIQEIMNESNKELEKPCYGHQHSRLLLDQLRQSNHDRLADLLSSLNDEPRSRPPVVKTRQYYSDINERALYNFSGLSVSERHSFFYPFTKTGFQEALKTGKLPDGSELVQVEPGIYRDHLGIIRTKHGPFWPIDSGPMIPAPIHKRPIRQKTEPLRKSSNVFRENSSQSSDVDWQRQPEQRQQEQRQQRPAPYDSLCAHNQDHRQSINVQQRQQQQQQQQQQLRADLSQQFVRYPGKWRGVVVIFDSEKSPKGYSPPAAPEGQCPSLVFESRFESGNLRQARRVGQFDYELVLSTDLYTKRHTQWYYFQVQNAEPNVVYTFKIINLLKRDSLYAYGMQPLFYSEHLSKTKDVGWVRIGHEISYTRNLGSLQCPLLSRERNYFVLEWQMEFPSAGDTCYLAHCYPYTFTDLRRDLDDLLGDAERSKCTKVDVLCQTKTGNSCFLITVTDDPLGSEVSAEKQGIVVTARVHPGETNSSWIMRGLLHHITGSSVSARELRKNFIFKIVPMINPDGVIVGNYRCCLSGHDLNRNYRKPSVDAFPAVWHIKEMISRLNSSIPILLYCDIHGHSRKQNVFMYGCAADQDRYTDENPIAYLRHRLFPWLMAKKCPDKFSYPGCKFQIHRCKESTGRVVMYRQLRISNSYTMEATFCGTTICKDERKHFNILDFEEMGKVLCEVALEYRKTRENVGLESKVLHEMMKYLVEKLISQNLSLKENVGNSDELGSSEKPNSFGREERSCVADAFASNRNSYLLTFDSSSLNSLESCIELSRKLSLTKQLKESDSSDSDSESEPEFVPAKLRLHRRKRRKKAKGQKSDSKPGDAEIGATDLLGGRDLVTEQSSAAQSNSEFPTIDSLELESKLKKKCKKKAISLDADQPIIPRQHAQRSYPQFVNKYEGRSNGGIPCFAEERILYRAAKRTAELEKKIDKELRLDEDDEFQFYPDYPIVARDYGRSLAFCVCDQLVSVQSLPSCSNRTSVLTESQTERVGGNNRSDYLVLLCSRCGLPQRQNWNWRNPLFADAASSFVRLKFLPVTSNGERFQDSVDSRLNFPFDFPSSSANRFKPDYGSASQSSRAVLASDEMKYDATCLSSTAGNTGKYSKSLLRQTERQHPSAMKHYE